MSPLQGSDVRRTSNSIRRVLAILSVTRKAYRRRGARSSTGIRRRFSRARRGISEPRRPRDDGARRPVGRVGAEGAEQTARPAQGDLGTGRVARQGLPRADRPSQRAVASCCAPAGRAKPRGGRPLAGGRFRPATISIEVQLHYTGGHEAALATALIELAEREGVPWVATQDPRYVDSAAGSCTTCSPRCATT